MLNPARSHKSTGRHQALLGHLRRQEGIGLAETLVAVAIMSLTMVALLSAFSTGALALRKADMKITAETLARNQMEYAKSQPFLVAPVSYPLITPVPADYVVSAQANPVSGRDSNIQKLTITVQRNGDTLFTLEDFKRNQ